MTEEQQHELPKSARYPLFLLGLLVIILGELLVSWVNAGKIAGAAIGAVGFIFLIASVALR